MRGEPSRNLQGRVGAAYEVWSTKECDRASIWYD